MTECPVDTAAHLVFPSDSFCRKALFSRWTFLINYMRANEGKLSNLIITTKQQIPAPARIIQVGVEEQLFALQSNMCFISKIQIDLPRGKQEGILQKSWGFFRLVVLMIPMTKTECKPHRKSLFTEEKISIYCFKDRVEQQSWALADRYSSFSLIFLGHIPWAQGFHWEFLSTWKYSHLGKHQKTPMEQKEAKSCKGHLLMGL